MANDDGDAVEGAPVVVRLVALALEFALELHSADGDERQCLLPISECGASEGSVYRILTVSKGWVAVTAPQAAMPPAMKALDLVLVGCHADPESKDLGLTPGL